MNIGIYIYENAEVLDFSGPFEVFSTAKRLRAKDWDIFFIAETPDPVTARGGFQVLPHYSFNDHPHIDILIVVGGIHTEEMNKAEVLAWIKHIDKTSTHVVSVCTGVFLLAKVQLFTQLFVTTHWEDIPMLIETFPALNVIDNKRWVCDGKYITSGGISAGIDMSLYLVSKLQSLVLAEQVAHQMEYHWQQYP